MKSPGPTPTLHVSLTSGWDFLVSLLPPSISISPPSSLLSQNNQQRISKSLFLSVNLFLSLVITIDTIRQIVKLKQVMQMWRSMTMSTHSRFDDSDESDSSRPRVPPGYFAVYVGAERRRFVIPTRFLNLPIFVSLLERAEEEFGLQMNGGLVLPCEVGFFERLVREIEKDEDVARMKGLDLNEVLRRFSDVGLDSCKEEKCSSCQVFTTPLLHKA